MWKQNTAPVTHSRELDASEPTGPLAGIRQSGPDASEVDQSYEAAGCWTPVAMRLALDDSDEEM